MTKKEIYEFVVKDSGFLSNEILFFDDIKENIESCENVGMKGYKVCLLYTSPSPRDRG